MRPLLAAQLTSSIDIESPTETNSDGVVAETFTPLAHGVPAEVIARESMTAKQAAAISARTTHLVTLRIRSDVTSRCRLVLPGTRYLNLVGPPRRVPEARPVYLVMECMETE